MNITFKTSSELIDNYKMLQIASAANKMVALCDERHHLFSISEDYKFYVMSETHGDVTAYCEYDLSQPLMEMYRGQQVAVKNFEVMKMEEGYFIALVLTIDKEDYLFVSCEKEITQPVWKCITYDNAQITKKEIQNLYCEVFEEQKVLICDLVNSDDCIARYYINFKETVQQGKKWMSHPLPADFEMTHNACIGKKLNDFIPGIYTLGKIVNKQQLIYTPVYNVFDPTLIPNPIRLSLSDEVDVITCSVTSIGEKKQNATHLWACGKGSLYLYPADKQKDGVQPIKVAMSNKFIGVKALYAYELEDKVYIYGYNQNHEVFYCFANKAQIEDPKGWSMPLTFMKDVSYFYPYIYEKLQTESFLAYGDDHALIIGDKDKTTSIWSNKQVDLPKQEGKAQKFTSFTTKITIYDENKQLIKNTPVYVQAERGCGVYINQKYYAFEDTPIEIVTSEQGTIKIIEKDKALQATNFKVSINEGTETVITPSDKALSGLLDLNTSQKLKAAEIQDEKGNRKLVSSDISDEELEAVAAGINQLVIATPTIYENTYLKSKVSNPTNLKFLGPTGVIFSIRNHKLSSTEGIEAFKQAEKFQLLSAICEGENKIYTVNRNLNLKGDFGGRVAYSLSDVLNFIKHIGEEICDFFIGIIEDVCQFVVKIGEAIYSFVLDCAEKMLACVETLFSIIKVAIEDVIAFLKYLFNWEDIVRTKNVLKKLFNLGVVQMEKDIQETQGEIDKVFDQVVQEINEWAGLEPIPEMDSQSVNTLINDNESSDTTDVVSSFLLDHLTENGAEARAVSQTLTISTHTQLMTDLMETKSYEEIFKDLADEEIDVLNQVIKQFKDVVFTSDLVNKDFTTIVKEVVGILAAAIVEGTKGVIDAVLELVPAFLETIKEAFNYEIYIPVLSDILEDYLGIQPFSMLDIISLVASVIVTPATKLILKKELITDAMYEKIMHAECLGDIIGGQNMKALSQDEGILQAVPKGSGIAELCIVSHMVSGFAKLMDVLIHPIKLGDSDDTSIKIISAVMSGMSAGTAFVGYELYSSYKSPIYITTLKTIFKYIPLTCVGVNAVWPFIGKGKLSFLSSKGFGICANVIYAIGNAMDIVLNSLLIADVVKQYKAQKKDKQDYETALVECSANLVANLVCILDVITAYDKEQYSRITFEVIREVLALGYSGAQTGESILIASL